MELAGLVAREIERLQPDMTFIDMGSFGAAVYDRLLELRYRCRCPAPSTASIAPPCRRLPPRAAAAGTRWRSPGRTMRAPHPPRRRPPAAPRSAEHTSALPSLMPLSYAAFCL